MVPTRMMSNALDDAAGVDGFDNGVGVRKMMMVFVCVCVRLHTMGSEGVVVMLKDKRTMMMNGEYESCVCVCVSGSDAEQPAICRQINPGCA